jgi:bacterioferritin-associated ferredoxin
VTEVIRPGKREGIIRVVETESQNRRPRKTMIICVCRGKSDRDVNRAIERGASSVADLQRCGIGTECGSCHSLLRVMLAEARERDSVAVSATPIPAESPAPAA